MPLVHEDNWTHHRESIIRLYWEENLPLHDVRDIMKRDYGFDASLVLKRLDFSTLFLFGLSMS